MLENLKKTLQEKIETNAVKSEMTWTKKSGEVVTEQVYLKRSRLPLVGDWARVYPPINEDGSWNLMNTIFGGKQNFWKLIGIMFILFMLYLWVTGLMGANKEYMNGDKYVIVSKDVFDKYFNKVLYSDSVTSSINSENMTIYILKGEG